MYCTSVCCRFVVVVVFSTKIFCFNFIPISKSDEVNPGSPTKLYSLRRRMTIFGHNTVSI